MIWFDRRMGPAIGTNKRVAKADIRVTYLDLETDLTANEFALILSGSLNTEIFVFGEPSDWLRAHNL